MRKLITIHKVKYLGDYVLGLTFSDSTYREISFKYFLFNTKNPMTTKYQDESQFTSFNLDYGDLNWNDYELCFPISDLYKGKI